MRLSAPKPLKALLAVALLALAVTAPTAPPLAAGPVSDTDDLVVDFAADTTSGINPVTVSFTNLTTGGPPTVLFWHFGDGVTSTVENPTHTYTTPGLYTVSLTAYLGLEIASIDKVDLILVEPATFVPDFTATPTAGPAPLTVTFTGTTEGAEPDWWDWDFAGSPGFVNGPVAEHTFVEPGVYAATLTTGFGGQTASVTKTSFITVGEFPVCVAKQKWLAADAVAGDHFGASVAIEGDLAVVGAPSWFPSIKGFAEVFEVTTGERIVTLAAPGELSNDEFGQSVDLDGDLIAVGAMLSNEVHLFDVQGTHLATIEGPSPGLFGHAIALDGSRLVVGARNDSELGELAGAAYVYDVGDPTEPVLIDKLLAEDGKAYDVFGHDVAISGDRILIGAFGHLNDAPSAAYLFELPEVGPPLPAGKLQLLGGNAYDQFGMTVALSGDLALVGAPFASGSFGGGIVAVFDVATGGQIAILAPPDLPGASDFGSSLAFDGTTVLVGAPYGNEAFHFDLSDPTAPELVVRLVPQDPGSNDEFGMSAAFDGETAIIGAWEHDDGGVNAGAAYVFSLGLGTWTDLGQGLAGAAGVPTLSGTGTLTGACTLNLLLTGAAETAPTFLVVGFTELSTPLLGGVLVPSPDLVVPGLTDSSGDVLLGATLPNGLPAGTSLILQHWIVDADGPAGFAASNGLRATTP